MAWGGSLNNEGSEYLRIINAADRAIQYLESLKEFLTETEKESVNKTIDIITDHINRLTQGKIID